MNKTIQATWNGETYTWTITDPESANYLYDYLDKNNFKNINTI